MQSSMKILVVDDNPTNVIILETILRNEGFRHVKSYHSAKQMLEHFKQQGEEQVSAQGIDLILLDMMMPELNGIDACHILQQSPQLREIPVIMVTAIGDSYKMAEALDAGAVDYVTKPINKIELMARIRSALRLQQEKITNRRWDRRIRNELSLARKVQESMLSPNLRDEEIRLTAYYEPCYELAGDLYSWYRISKNQYHIILLDMMGHGISSSLMCMYIASAIKDAVIESPLPHHVLKELNRKMNHLQEGNGLMPYFFTAIDLLIDTAKRTVSYVNAGHPTALMRTGDKVIPLDPNADAIGMDDAWRGRTRKISFYENAELVLFTDGVAETYVRNASLAPIRDELEHDILIRDLSNGNIKWGADSFAGLVMNEDAEVAKQDDRCLLHIHVGKESRS